MKALSKLQVRFLDAVARGQKDVAAILSDMGLTYRHVNRWRQTPRFEAALAEVNRWLAFQRETDARIVAAAATGRARRRLADPRALRGHERGEVREVMQFAARSDRGLPAGVATAARLGKPAPCAIHPRFSPAEAKALVERMEALRRKAEEGKKRE